ncbi:hypothetical protein BJX64DRAFT_66894 [Aspergillus heterothallicus]
MAGEVTAIVTHYPKQDKIEEFRDLCLRVKNIFKDFPGKLDQHAIEVETEEGVEIIVIEKFKDQESADNVLASDEFKKVGELVPALVRLPPKVIQGTPLPGFRTSEKGI